MGDPINADIVSQQAQYHSIVVEMLKQIHENIMMGEANSYNPIEKKDRQRAAVVGMRYLTAYVKSVGYKQTTNPEEMRKELTKIMQDENGEIEAQDKSYIELLISCVMSNCMPAITLQEVSKKY